MAIDNRYVIKQYASRKKNMPFWSRLFVLPIQYGWHLTVRVKLHKAQLEQIHSSKQSELTMIFKEKMKMLSNEKQPARVVLTNAKWLRSTPDEGFRSPNGRQALSGNEFERNVQKNSPGAVLI